MTWAAPLAFAGLALLALPIAIHLMGLGRARVRPFPSLRFLETARLLPSRRTRIHDAALLAVRLAVLAAAVVALARPLRPGAAGGGAGDGVVRAVIVDTSVSMLRPTSGGVAAVDAARRIADTLASGATAALTLPTDDPRAAVSGAVAWLGSRAGRRELVVISDFQVGAFDAAREVPPGIAVRPVKIPVDASRELRVEYLQSGRVASAQATVGNGRTEVRWASGAPGTVRGAEILAGAGEALRAEAGIAASRTIGAAVAVPSPATDGAAGRVAVVYPAFANRETLLAGASGLRHAWQGDLAGRLRDDSLLAAVALDANPMAAGAAPPGAAVVARTSSGEPVVMAASDGADPGARLLVVLNADPGSDVSVALHAALARAGDVPAPERDPAVLSDEAVATLAREASPAGSGLAEGFALPCGSTTGALADAGAPSVARWLWALAITLLAAEALYRRSLSTRPTAVPPSGPDVAG